MNSLFDQTEPATPIPGIRKRPYQIEAIENAFRLWLKVIGVLIRLATGMGKTATAAFIAKRWLAQGPDYRVMVLTHEKQLTNQWPDEIRKFSGYEPLIEMGKQKVEEESIPSVVIASRASLLQRYSPRDVNLMGHHSRVNMRWSRLEKFDPRFHWLVVIDEAHRYAMKLTSCGHIFDHFKQNPLSRFLGLTATPQRTDGTTLERILPGIGIDYRMAAGTPNAMEEGWCVPFRQIFISCDGVDLTNIDIVRGDFSREQLAAVMTEQKTLNAVCQPMLDHVGARPTLIFSATVEAAEAVALWLNSKAGHRVAASLNGDDKDYHRERVYQDFYDGHIQFLSVCMLAREGYNNDRIGAIAIFRPTKSQSLAEQMKGRGCRPLKGLIDHLDTAEERRAAIAASAKPDCIIIDVVGVSSLDDVASTVDIYLDGEPDEIRARAKTILESGDTEDPREAIEQARAEEEEERRLQEQKLARETEERRQREMDRRAKIEAEVRYEATLVNSGHSLGNSRTASQEWAANETMRFGKHRGKRIGNLSSDYLSWMVKQMPKSKIGRAAAVELQARQAPKPKPKPAPPQPKAVTVEDVNRALQEAMYER